MNVSNRNLLRDYKSLKNKLMRGQVSFIDVPQKDGTVLRITVLSKESRAERWLNKIATLPPLTYVQRPEEDIFDR